MIVMAIRFAIIIIIRRRQQICGGECESAGQKSIKGPNKNLSFDLLVWGFIPPPPNYYNFGSKEVGDCQSTAV